MSELFQSCRKSGSESARHLSLAALQEVARCCFRYWRYPNISTIRNYFSHFAIVLRQKGQKCVYNTICNRSICRENVVKISILQNMIVLILSEILIRQRTITIIAIAFHFSFSLPYLPLPVSLIRSQFDWRWWSRPCVKSNSKQINWAIASSVLPTIKCLKVIKRFTLMF